MHLQDWHTPLKDKNFTAILGGKCIECHKNSHKSFSWSKVEETAGYIKKVSVTSDGVIQVTLCNSNTSCAACGKAPDSANLLKRCGGCKCVLYCSPECQKQDWRERHKSVCSKAASRVAINMATKRQSEQEASAEVVSSRALTIKIS